MNSFQAHKYLCEKRQVLHRDISYDNIMFCPQLPPSHPGDPPLSTTPETSADVDNTASCTSAHHSPAGPSPAVLPPTTPETGTDVDNAAGCTSAHHSPAPSPAVLSPATPETGADVDNAAGCTSAHYSPAPSPAVLSPSTPETGADVDNAAGPSPVGPGSALGADAPAHPDAAGPSPVDTPPGVETCTDAGTSSTPGVVDQL